MGVMYEDGVFNTCYCDKCEHRIAFKEPMFETNEFDELCDRCFVEELIKDNTILEHDDDYEIDGRSFDSFYDLVKYLEKNYDYVDKEKRYLW